ncbi:hypothetical protein D9M68_250710 [compost metagenome]
MVATVVNAAENAAETAAGKRHERQSIGHKLIAAIAMPAVTTRPCILLYQSRRQTACDFVRSGLYEVGHRQPNQQNRPHYSPDSLTNSEKQAFLFAVCKAVEIAMLSRRWVEINRRGLLVLVDGDASFVFFKNNMRR